MVELFAILWQLPQEIAGAVLWLICKLRGRKTYATRGRLHTHWALFSGISLGHFIFTNENAMQRTFDHEYGHTLQSRLLGVFYLLVIGLPSIIWAGCFGKYRTAHGVSYYSFYTERWADKLGKVER